MAIDANGWPSTASVSGTAPSHSGWPCVVADDQVRRGPEAVLVERVASDRQRVVHPDRLAGDLLAIAVDRQVGREVGGIAGLEAGRLEVEVLDEQQAGRADGLDRQRLALGDHQALLVAQPGGHRGREQEQDQAEVGEQRRELRVLVPVAVDEPRPVRRLGLTDAGSHACERRAGRRPADTSRIAARSGSFGSKNGSGWTTRDVRTAAPQPGHPVERAAHDRDDEDNERER